MKTTKLEIYGRVQGVFFRVNTKKCADRLGLKGSVTNKEDGSVLIITQCPNKKLKELKDWIKKNPGMSKVNEIKEKTIKIKKKYNDFQIIKKNSFLKDKKKALKNLVKSIF